jgi:hypothetical protein
MASELRVNTLKDAAGANSVAMTYVAGGSAKVWASWNSTTTVQDSLNISSLSDSGSGVTVHNFSSSFSNALFSTSGSHDRLGGNINSFLVNAFATTSVTTSTYTNAGAIDASVLASSNVHGDLA